jgi:hypothetical protein
MIKKGILLVVAIIILAFVYRVPLYNFWFKNNILNYKVILEQSKYMGLEERKNIRFGNSYIMYRQMAEILKKQGGPDPIILLPPDDYIQQYGIKDFHIVEPLEFYYFTGLRAVTIESKDVERATWTLSPAKDQPLVLTRIPSAEELGKLIAVYKKFLPRL